jgi:hypothetical protein
MDWLVEKMFHSFKAFLAIIKSVSAIFYVMHDMITDPERKFIIIRIQSVITILVAVG